MISTGSTSTWFETSDTPGIYDKNCPTITPNYLVFLPKTSQCLSFTWEYSQRQFIQVQINTNMTSLTPSITHRINLTGRFKRFSLTKFYMSETFGKQIILAGTRCFRQQKMRENFTWTPGSAGPFNTYSTFLEQADAYKTLTFLESLLLGFQMCFGLCYATLLIRIFKLEVNQVGREAGFWALCRGRLQQTQCSS